MTYPGLPADALAFLSDLAANNSRDWFQAHRDRYERSLLAPARALVEALGPHLRPFAPDVVADSRINRSLFRLNRDTRFSRNKDPYKTNLGLWFWEGPGKRMTCPGFYLQVEPNRLMLAAGLYVIPKELLPRYRDTIAHQPHRAEALQDALDRIQSRGYGISGDALKRTPRGYPKDHPHADLLKRKGIVASIDFTPPPDLLHTPDVVPWCAEHFAAMAPLHHWFLELLRSPDATPDASDDDAPQADPKAPTQLRTTPKLII